MSAKRAVIIITLLLFSGFLLQIPQETKSDGYGDYPPPAVGDWNIIVDTYVGNETIVLNGNLTIQSGGNLTLKNSTLKLNCSSDGQYYNEVQSGGSMKILDLDGDNLTTNDASWITANNTDYEFNFWVRDGASFEMRNSNLTECGYFWGGVLEKEGLLIQTDDAIVEHSWINNCTRGVILYGSDAKVSNNTIEWCDTGVRTSAWSNGTIERNVIVRSGTYGIQVD
ncbi:right-handed parallel beta-helix repeat-containing protein, partial [Candidatus Woesearchaeota archaeon]|nr:right-handed parallel beta-helix repeat-containing protein [Candidatus Woesearchaeota archaeon]